MQKKTQKDLTLEVIKEVQQQVQWNIEREKDLLQWLGERMAELFDLSAQDLDS